MNLRYYAIGAAVIGAVMVGFETAPVITTMWLFVLIPLALGILAWRWYRTTGIGG